MRKQEPPDLRLHLPLFVDSARINVSSRQRLTDRYVPIRDSSAAGPPINVPLLEPALFCDLETT
jgi:hypothetical protein